MDTPTRLHEHADRMGPTDVRLQSGGRQRYRIAPVHDAAKTKGRRALTDLDGLEPPPQQRRRTQPHSNETMLYIAEAHRLLRRHA